MVLITCHICNLLRGYSILRKETVKTAASVCNSLSFMHNIDNF